VGMPFREVEYPFEFGFGINDLVANINYLKKIKRLDEVELAEAHVKGDSYWNWPFMKELDEATDAEYRTETKRIANAVIASWREIETTFLPRRSKY